MFQTAAHTQNQNLIRIWSTDVLYLQEMDKLCG